MKTSKTVVLFLMICTLLMGFDVRKSKASLVNSASNFVIVAESFDYSDNLDWGFFEEQNTSNSGDEFIMEYNGFTKEQQDDLTNHPEHWKKGWVRVKVKPSVGYPFENMSPKSQNLYEFMQSKYGESNPLYYGNMIIENVRIDQCNEIGIFPKSYMVFGENPNGFNDPNMSSSTKEESDLWYLEIIIYSLGKNNKQIEEAITSLSAKMDVYYFNNVDISYQQNIVVSLNGITRVRLFQKDAVSIRALQCKKSDVGIYDIINQYENIGGATASEVEENPGIFQIYQLSLKIDKHAPWSITNITKFNAQAKDSIWLVYYNSITFENYTFSGELVKNEPLTDYYLLIRTDNVNNTITEEELKNLSLSISISTEFAGFFNHQGGEGVLGYIGMPYTLVIDMTKCKLII